MQASKSLAKRQREETEATAAQKAAKKLRQEMKQRGHVGVLKKGEDPASDAHEKTLYRTATRSFPLQYHCNAARTNLLA